MGAGPVRRPTIQTAAAIANRRAGRRQQQPSSATGPVDTDWRSLRRRRRSQLVAQRLQIEQQVLHDLIPLLAILAHGLAHDALQLAQERRLEARQGRRLVIEDGGQDVAAARAGERPPPGDHLVQQHAERPDVGSARPRWPRACSGDM